MKNPNNKPCLASSKKLANSAWKLIHYSITPIAASAEESNEILGAEGILIYTDSLMSVHVVEPADSNHPGGYRSTFYSGAYRFDEASSIVSHRIEICNIPQWVGVLQQRQVYLHQDRLELRTVSPLFLNDHYADAVLCWRRFS